MNFSIGDLVQLKSGGPVMTISHVSESGHCTCVWFHSYEAKEESVRHFPQAILSLTE